MKRTVAVIAVLAVLLSILSCEKAPSVPPQTKAPVADAEPAEVKVPVAAGADAGVADAKSGLVILGGLGFNELVDGKAIYKDGITLGEKVALRGKTAKATQYGRERDFILVRRDSGKEGWVWPDFVVSSATLSLVIDADAIVYKEPKNTAATDKTIPKMTVLAAHSEPAGSSFVKVTAYDPEAKVLQKEVFLKREVISSKPDDVQSVILLQLAATAKSTKQKEALLKSAIKDYPGSAFITQIEAALAALAPRTSSRPAEKFSATMVSNDSPVMVRDTPDEQSGKVVGSLGRGQVVVAEERTTESYTVADKTAPWYRIKEPAGWVFGGFLGPRD